MKLDDMREKREQFFISNAIIPDCFIPSNYLRNKYFADCQEIFEKIGVSEPYFLKCELIFERI